MSERDAGQTQLPGSGSFLTSCSALGVHRRRLLLSAGVCHFDLTSVAHRTGQTDSQPPLHLQRTRISIILRHSFIYCCSVFLFSLLSLLSLTFVLVLIFSNRLLSYTLPLFQVSTLADICPAILHRLHPHRTAIEEPCKPSLDYHSSHSVLEPDRTAPPDLPFPTLSLLDLRNWLLCEPYHRLEASSLRPIIGFPPLARLGLA